MSFLIFRSSIRGLFHALTILIKLIKQTAIEVGYTYGKRSRLVQV
ncbi:hypothetical protein [Isorropodon fossajaponicum symbiont]|nr:hypothetical protein [Isorropodon fossajaponicum symbiont]